MNTYFSKFTILFFTTFLLLSCQQKPMVVTKKETTVRTPKNIILMIGDGMGLSQVSASIYYKENSSFEHFPIIGLCKTSSSNELITDSAAGATALSTGNKTYNGAIGVNKDTIPIETIYEYISKIGFSTGLVSTSSVVHATPASFYAHSKHRKSYEEIATFLPRSDIDFFAGGGLQFFNKRKDGKNLVSNFKENGFIIDTLQLSETHSKQKYGFLLAEDGMPKIIEGRDDFLPEATAIALDFLSKNEKGFMLMVEGAQIDWGGHNMDANYLITEQLDFDNTLEVALDFAKQNTETLVIVTADHETGGFTLASKKGNYNEINPKFATDGHSATMVPVFAYGPGAELFSGIYENTEIYHKMKALLQSH